MFIMDGLKIEISKGDCGVFTISFTGEDAPTDGTTVLVSLKKTPAATDAIWEKRLTVVAGSVTVELNTADTNLTPGGYYWDARIIYPDGYVFTPIDPSAFTVRRVVGNV